jgi:hypothetical protein
MSRLRVLASLAVAVLVLATGSCSSDHSPTGVAPDAIALDSAAAPSSLLGGLLRPTGLLQCRPLAAATATKTIGKAGGVIEVGPHALWIPAGALDRDVTITAEMPSDDVNTVILSPHGLEFDRSAWLTMSYANCNIVAWLLPKRIAYTDNLLNVLYYLLSLDNLWTRQVTGKVDHFSRYAVSW